LADKRSAVEIHTQKLEALSSDRHQLELRERQYKDHYQHEVEALQ